VTFIVSTWSGLLWLSCSVHVLNIDVLTEPRSWRSTDWLVTHNASYWWHAWRPVTHSRTFGQPQSRHLL